MTPSFFGYSYLDAIKQSGIITANKSTKKMENYISINGKKIKLSDETARELQEQLGGKENLPKKWEELYFVKGYFVSNNHVVGATFPDSGYSTLEENKNVWPTRELAEAALAMSQIAQLRDRYNNGWMPDWRNVNEDKYCVSVYRGKISREKRWEAQKFLAFKTKELRDMFLENFRDLIETAKPLL